MDVTTGKHTRWPMVRLGDVCAIEIGRTPSRSDSVLWDKEKKTNNVWVSIADLSQNENSLISESAEYISDKAKQKMNIVPAGTLLVSFKLSLGKMSFAARDLYTNEAIAALIPFKQNELSVKFLHYCLLGFRWKDYAAGDIKVKGMTLNKAKLKDIPLPLPPLAEQQRIVARLDAAFAAIAEASAAAEANLRNARALFDSYLDQVFSTRGAGWVERRLGDVALDFGRGKSKHRPRNAPELFGGKYPFIQTGEVRNSSRFITEFTQTYNEKGLQQSKLWPKGTICITIAANIAETAVLDFDACFPDSIIGLVVDPQKAHNSFVVHMLQHHKKYLQSLSKGSAQANINLGTFEDEWFYFPTINEQVQIDKQLTLVQLECESMNESYQQKLAALAELKQSLLAEVFGQVE